MIRLLAVAVIASGLALALAPPVVAGETGEDAYEAFTARAAEDDRTAAQIESLGEEPLSKASAAITLFFLKGYEVHKELGGEWDDTIGRWFLRRLAGRGMAPAQELLAIIYEDGSGGVEQDYAEAARWYRMAAEQGDEHAQFFLGRMYFYGRGVEQSDAEAVFWVRRAAEQGHLDAVNAMGGAYYEGRGVPQDFSEAVIWFRRAAERGDPYGQLFMGVAYFWGRGVSQDRAEAITWYRKAAEQGEAKSQFTLAGIYERGEGVAPDLDQAKYWYRKAAAQGDEAARERLEALER